MYYTDLCKVKRLKDKIILYINQLFKDFILQSDLKKMISQ